jgi:hypothetical protein
MKILQVEIPKDYKADVIVKYEPGDHMFKIGDHIWAGDYGHVVMGIERPPKEVDIPGTVGLILSKKI